MHPKTSFSSMGAREVLAEARRLEAIGEAQAACALYIRAFKMDPSLDESEAEFVEQPSSAAQTPQQQERERAGGSVALTTRRRQRLQWWWACRS